MRGLRILARMIVRAHQDAQGDGGCQDSEETATDVPGKDGEHVG